MGFYEKLIYLIEERGITKNRLLTDLNINRNSIQNWQKQGSKPRIDTLTQIADYFNVSVESLSNDDMELEYEPSVKKSQAKKLFSFFQRSFSLCGGYVLNDEKLNNFSHLLNANVLFLTNLSEGEYNPEKHQVDKQIEVDYSTLFDIFELADRCAETDPQRVVMIQISRVMLHWIKKYSEQQNDENKINLYECKYLSKEKLDYLYTNKSSINAAMNFGLNFTEITAIHNFTNLSYYYLFTGKEKN